MKKYLKVQTNDQLKESQSALQKSQSTVLDLRRQLRKAQNELELLKCGGKIDAGTPQSAYNVPVSDCRRLLQQVSNIVYSDSSKQPNVFQIPSIVSTLKQNVASVSNTSLTSVLDNNSRITVSAQDASQSFHRTPKRAD